MADPTNDGHILHEVDVETAVREDLESPGQVAFTNPSIAAASTTVVLSASYTKAEIETALNNLGTKLNAAIAVLKANGIVASP